MSTGTEHPAPIPESAAHPPPALVPGPFAHALSVGLGVVTVAAAAPTVLIDDVLRGPAAMNGSARGTALVMLLVGVPLLLVGQLATRRDHGWALPIWLGSTAYLLYNAFMLLFATPFNALFLLYVGTFSLALWTLVAILRVAEVAAFGRPGSPVGERRSIAVFTWVVVALNAAAWLRAIVNGLPDTAGAAFLQGTGLTTAPTYVQDLAAWLPLMAVAAYWLWRGLGWGYLVVASLLAMWVVECITIAVDQYLGSIADPAATMVSSSMTPLFVVLALVMAVPTVLLLRRM